MRRRGKSPWLEAERNRTLETMLPCVAERIAAGEHPLEVWSQQRCVPLKTVARKTRIEIWRLLAAIDRETALSVDEVAVIARELRIAPHLLAGPAGEGGGGS